MRQRQPVVEMPSEGPEEAASRGWRIPALALSIAVVLVVGGLFGADPQLSDERIDPASPLAAPTDPVGSTAPPFVDSEGSPPSPMAGGWEVLAFPGPGPLWAVAAGDGGWAAVTGNDPPAVWVSPNAATWLYRALPTEGPVSGVSVAVSAGSLAVVTTSFDRDHPLSTAWLSEDGAQTWTSVPFPTPAEVTGIERTSVGWVAYGTAGPGADAEDRLSRDPDWKPAVWHLGAEGVVAYEFLVDPGRDGEVSAVIERAETVVVLGRVFTGPRGWNLRDGTLSPFIPVTPADAVAFGFGSAAELGADRVVATLGVGAGPTSRLVTSGDLTSWTAIETGGTRVVSRLDEAGEYVIGLGESVGPPFLLASDDGAVWDVISSTEPGGGLAGATAFVSAAGDGDVVVVGGFRGADPALWRWGGERDLGWVVQGPPATEGRWVQVAQVEQSGPSDESIPLSAVVLGNEALIADGGRVMWIPDISDPEAMIPARLDRPVRLVTVGDEVYALEYPGRAAIHPYTGGATWDTTVLWEGYLAGITLLDGTLTAFGVLADNGTNVRSAAAGQGRWSDPEPLPAPGSWEPFSFDGTVARFHGQQLQLSTDGELFSDVPGDPRGFAQGLAALVEGIPAVGSRVTLPVASGDDRVWEVPVSDVRSVYLAGERLVVLGEGRVVREAADGWERLPPLDLGHGVFGNVEALLTPAGGEVFAVGRVDGDLTVWRYQP